MRVQLGASPKRRAETPKYSLCKCHNNVDRLQSFISSWNFPKRKFHLNFSFAKASRAALSLCTRVNLPHSQCKVHCSWFQTTSSPGHVPHEHQCLQYGAVSSQRAPREAWKCSVTSYRSFCSFWLEDFMLVNVGESINNDQRGFWKHIRRSLRPVTGGPEETFGVNSQPRAFSGKTEIERGQNLDVELDEECG